MGSEWKYMPFTVAVVVNPQVNLKRGESYPFVDMQSIDPSKPIVEASRLRKFKGSGAKFEPYDTLMARITPCLENGKIARYVPNDEYQGSAFGSTEFIVIRGRDGITDNDFAYYLTRWNKFRSFAIAQMSGSSGRQRVSAESLAGFEVPIPPLPEQRAIAHILGTLDDKIELNRKMNETLETMAQTLFKSWFVDFDPVVVNALRAGNPIPEKFARAAAHYRKNPEALGLPDHILRLFPDRFVDSELGPIPEGWEVTRLRTEFNLTMGQSPPGSTYNEEGKGLPFFQGRRDFSFRYPTKRVYCTTPTRIANPGDTLLSVRAPVGDINMAWETCCIGRGIASIRHKSGSRSYTYYLIKTIANRFKKYNSEGTVFGAITKRHIENFLIISPHQKCISLFEEIVYPFDEKILNFEEEIRSLNWIRDILLPKLISGELRVKDVERIVENQI